MVYVERNIFSDLPLSSFEMTFDHHNGSQWVISEWSRQAREVYGYEKNEIIGRSADTLLVRDLQKEKDAIVGRLRHGKKIENFEALCLKKNGLPIIVSMFLYPVYDIRSKNVVSVYCYIDDITSYFGFTKFFHEIVQAKGKKHNEGNELLHKALRLSLKYENARLYFGRKEKTLPFLETMNTALQFFDKYTYGHSERVSAYAKAIGTQLGLSPEAMQRLEVAAPIHDIGKLGISQDILNTQGKLTQAQMAQVRYHSENGAHLLSLLGFDGTLVEAVRGHHERYDGDGYPAHLKGDTIPL